MTTFAISDVQGCFAELQALLSLLDFRADRDQLWFVGDLVNRGPQSLEVLRFVRSLGDRAVCVLGNHDLHLLACAEGFGKLHHRDTLTSILNAPDRDQLLEWLRQQPLLHYDAALNFSMLHAGLPPQWTLQTALTRASEVETVLRSDHYPEFLAEMYGNKPKYWADDLHGMDRLRFITNCLTRMRYCSLDGKLALKEKGPPGSQNPKYLPWFSVPGRASQTERIVCGHWATLGYQAENQVWAIDTGCLWGGALTALKLGDVPEPIHYPCSGVLTPHEIQ